MTAYAASTNDEKSTYHMWGVKNESRTIVNSWVWIGGMEYIWLNFVIDSTLSTAVAESEKRFIN